MGTRVLKDSRYILNLFSIIVSSKFPVYNTALEVHGLQGKEWISCKRMTVGQHLFCNIVTNVNFIHQKIHCFLIGVKFLTVGHKVVYHCELVIVDAHEGSRKK